MSTTATANGRMEGLAGILKALAHPERLAIAIAMLDGAERSPAQLAEEIVPDAGFSKTAYHVRYMAKNGALTQTRREANKGAVSHYYVLSPPLTPIVQATMAVEL